MTYDLLIVDDQPDLVDELVEVLPWENVGINNVYKAYSSQEAIDILDLKTIDIMITDIDMPEMSGLELVEKIRQSDNRIRCIILTGYNEFQYAQKALKHHANDYLLKPVEDEELLNSVAKAIQDLQENIDKKDAYKATLDSIRKELPLLQNVLLSKLLSGQYFESKVLFEKLNLLEIPIQENSPFCIMLVRLDDYNGLYSGKDISLIKYSITNIVEEILSEHFILWGTNDHNGYLVFSVHLKTRFKGPKKEWFRQLEGYAKQVQHYVSQYLKWSISILLSEWGVFPNDTRSLYKNATIRFRQQIGNEKGLLLGNDLQLKQTNKPVISLSKLYEPPTLLHLLEAEQWKEIDLKLESIFNELEKNGGHSHEHIIEIYFTIISSISFSIHKSKLWLKDILETDFHSVISVEQFHTIYHLREWTKYILNNYKKAVEMAVKEDSHSTIVKHVQEYIHEHLNNVSLQSLADHVYLNPSYLSKIYKLETGEGISNYLLRLRMEKAAYLLQMTNEKIYEIATQVGYLKTSYFIKIFREKYGMTPQEFRNKV